MFPTSSRARWACWNRARSSSLPSGSAGSASSRGPTATSGPRLTKLPPRQCRTSPRRASRTTSCVTPAIYLRAGREPPCWLQLNEDFVGTADGGKRPRLRPVASRPEAGAPTSLDPTLSMRKIKFLPLRLLAAACPAAASRMRLFPAGPSGGRHNAGGRSPAAPAVHSAATDPVSSLRAGLPQSEDRNRPFARAPGCRRTIARTPNHVSGDGSRRMECRGGRQMGGLYSSGEHRSAARMPALPTSFPPGPPRPRRWIRPWSIPRRRPTSRLPA